MGHPHIDLKQFFPPLCSTASYREAWLLICVKLLRLLINWDIKAACCAARITSEDGSGLPYQVFRPNLSSRTLL
jgi:hypothetical protein